MGFIRRDGPEGGLCLKEGVITVWWKPGRGGEGRGGEGRRGEKRVGVEEIVF